MRKWTVSTILLFAVSVFSGIVHAQEAQTEVGTTYELSKPFATATEATAFASNPPAQFGPRIGYFPEFSCEFTDGAPVASSYRVTYLPAEVSDRSGLTWRAKEGFAALEEAVAFANANNFDFVQFVSCWNPYRNPASTTMTVFYLYSAEARSEMHGLPGDAYRVRGESFASPRDAAKFANEHLTGEALLTVQFVPQLFAAKQTESSWYVVVAEPTHPDTPGLIWTVQESDERRTPHTAESALAVRNADEKTLVQAVSTFSTAFLHSRVVLFRLVPADSGEKANEAAAEDVPSFRADTRAALLGIPAKIYVDEALLPIKGIGWATQTNVPNAAETAFEEFFRQTNIALWNESVWTYNSRGANPNTFAREVLRTPRSLNIFFSATPPSPSGHERSFEPGLHGEKFIIIWVRPDMTYRELIASLIHALAHKFAAQDVNNQASAMFFDGTQTGSSWIIDRGNLVLIRQMALLAKRWGSVDIAFSLAD